MHSYVWLSGYRLDSRWNICKPRIFHPTLYRGKELHLLKSDPLPIRVALHWPLKLPIFTGSG